MFIGEYGDGSLWTPPNVSLHDNGWFVIPSDEGILSGGYDLSRVQYVDLGLWTTGFGHQVSYDISVADEFVVPDGETWAVEFITFYEYQSLTSTAGTINDVRVRIWNGKPDEGGVVIWGDLTTNRLVSSTFCGVYRATDYSQPLDMLRPIMASVCAVDVEIDAGEYWVEWTAGGTALSGPWAVPVVIAGEGTTGNALQFYLGWADATDSQTGEPQGLAFVVEGTKVGIIGGGPVFVDSFEVEVGAIEVELDTAEFEIEIDIDDVGLDSEGGTIELDGLNVEVK